MTRIYRWSMMVYSSLQAEFMVTKYDGHIQGMEHLSLANMYLNRLTTIIK